MAATDEKNDIDMDLYSRQIGAFGVETMGKLVKMRIVIYGMRGVGVEIAKNIILAGPASVTLVDDTICEMGDLNTNFYIKAADVTAGKTRAAACQPQLAELNGYVKVEQKSGPLNETIMQEADVVVVTQGRFNEIIKWDLDCREKGRTFIWTENRGVTGFVFSDFGEKFTVLDNDGEPPISNMVTNVTLDNDQNPVFVTQGRHRLSDGDVLLFEEAKGDLSSLNGKKIAIKTKKGDQFTVNKEDFQCVLDAGFDGKKSLEYYFRAVQQKVPKELHFRSLMESIPNPVLPNDMLLIADFAAFDRPPQLHFAQIALSLFKDKNSRFPDLKNAEEAQRMYSFTKEIVEKHKTKFIDQGKDAIVVDQIDEAVLKKASLYSSVELPGMTAYLGGVVAQEIVKHTGKYTPLRQWLHVDCFQLVDDQVIIKTMKSENINFKWDKDGVITEADEKSDIEVGWVLDSINEVVLYGKTEEEKQSIIDDQTSKNEVKMQFRKPRDDALKEAEERTRYDPQIAVLGRETHKRLKEWTMFLVGAGALGCEYLKQLALMGVGVANSGEVHVTDMDRIEVSNLNRQFLFRKKDVGNPKSTTAGKAVSSMNPEFGVKSYEVRVGPDTENTFNVKFWNSMNVIVNALDNVKARQYVDRKCVWHTKPLMESGTLGTKANSQVILPHKTESYSDSVDPEEDAIPMCTLRNFPNQIEHCIEWARAEFNDLFTSGPQEVNSYLDDGEKYLAELKNDSSKEQVEKLEGLVDWLEAGKNPSLKKCVEMAHKRFFAQYRDRIRHLTDCFPEDARVSDDSGNDAGPFWSGMRRFPSPIEYKGEESHVDYIFNAANLFAFGLGLDPVKEKEKLADMAKDLPVPEFVSKVKAEEKIEQKDEYEVADDEEALEARAEELRKQLGALQAIKALQIAEFEKDDDTNFHIDFIAACSNLRATNYVIETVPRHKVKMIAGKIIPALATTTAMITGLIGIELYKLALGLDNVEAFRNSYCNLGIPQVLNQVEPTPPKKAEDGLDPETYMPVVSIPKGFTSWDKVTIQSGGKDLTIAEFVELLKKEHHGVVANVIGKYGVTKAEIEAGKGLIWTDNPGLSKEVQAQMKKILGGSLKARWTELYGEPDKNYLVLDIGSESASGDDAKIPKVKYMM